MTQMAAELGTPARTRGRQVKFTPERIQQIKNLVERGKTREEIAELIGVTVGSLQVTCSRLSISLRRPTSNKAIGVLRRDDARFSRVSAPGSNASAGALLQLTKEALERNSRPASVKPEAAPCQECGNRANEAAAASLAVQMQYRGEERTTELSLTQDMIGRTRIRGGVPERADRRAHRRTHCGVAEGGSAANDARAEGTRRR